MYLPDLSHYPLASPQEGSPILSIGWLDRKHPYNRGGASPLFLERLWVFCCNAVFYTLGYHSCPFCSDSPWGVLVQRADVEIRLGSAEIRVIGKDVVYAAPDLIYHYVERHNYCPPEEFVQAVLEGPLPGSPEYEAVKRSKGWL